MAANLNSVMLDSSILPKKLHSFILIQLDDSSHLEFCHFGFSHFHQKTPHSFWLKLMMAAILNSVMLDWDTVNLDSDTLLSSLSFTQKPSHTILTLIQTNSIWLKLIHFYLTWWWQPSWKIQTLSLWIQTPCYFLPDSLKNTLTPLWLWPKLIYSDSNSFSHT